MMATGCGNAAHSHSSTDKIGNKENTTIATTNAEAESRPLLLKKMFFNDVPYARKSRRLALALVSREVVSISTSRNDKDHTCNLCICNLTSYPP